METATPRTRQKAQTCGTSARVETIRSYDESLLSIRTPDVLARIERGDRSWEAMVPPAVAEIIKSKGLFRPRPAPATAGFSHSPSGRGPG